GDRFRQFSRIGNASVQTLYIGLYEKVTEYSLSVNSDYLHPSKFSGFGRLTRSRNYLANGSGVFAVVETDDTYSNTDLLRPEDNPGTVGTESTRQPKRGTCMLTSSVRSFA